MSVRDKIAGFGGSVGNGASRPNHGFRSTSRFETNASASSSGGRASTTASSSHGDPINKLTVPAVSKNAAKPAGFPNIAAAEQAPSSADIKGAPPGLKTGASNGVGVSAGSGDRVGSAAAAGGAAGYKAPSASDITKRTVSDTGKKPRDDISERGSLTTTASAPSLEHPVVDSPPNGLTGKRSSASSGDNDGKEPGRASPPSRSNKPKAGPRKLNLTRVSAEKQRAALCLDKDMGDGDGDNVKQGLPVGVKISAGIPTNTTGRSSGSSSGRNEGGQPPASSYTMRPAPASRSTPAKAVDGGAVRSAGGGIPSARSLRSSGHNLW